MSTEALPFTSAAPGHASVVRSPTVNCDTNNASTMSIAPSPLASPHSVHAGPGVGVTVGVFVTVGVCVGVSVPVGVRVGLWVGVDVTVGVRVGVSVAVGVAVGLDVVVAVAVAV